MLRLPCAVIEGLVRRDALHTGGREDLVLALVLDWVLRHDSEIAGSGAAAPSRLQVWAPPDSPPSQQPDPTAAALAAESRPESSSDGSPPRSASAGPESGPRSGADGALPAPSDSAAGAAQGARSGAGGDGAGQPPLGPLGRLEAAADRGEDDALERLVRHVRLPFVPARRICEVPIPAGLVVAYPSLRLSFIQPGPRRAPQRALALARSAFALAPRARQERGSCGRRWSRQIEQRVGRVRS